MTTHIEEDRESMTATTADAIDALRDAGWTGILVLPPAAKEPPPTGYTGQHARTPTDNDIARWLHQHGPHANLALHMPDDVIGVDLDLYRAPDARHGLEALTGPLPPTWCTTSRVDGSGIRLYRAPRLGPTQRWQTAPVPGVEIIQTRHRYALVHPSIHPVTGQHYRWVDETCGDIGDEPPTWEDLTELPWPAVEALIEAVDATPERPAATWDYPTGAPTRAVRRRLDQAIDACRSQPGGRHDATAGHVAALVRLGERGEPGVADALGQLRDTFVAAVADDRPGGRPHAEREFADLVTSAERKVAVTAPRIGTHDERRAELDPTSLISPTDTPTAPSEATDGPDEAPSGLAAWYVDWPAMWHRDRLIEDWLCEPFVAAGRGHALYAGAKTGKSWLTLEIAAALATGRAILRRPAGDPIHVLYLDYEMTLDDLRDRLETFGYDETSDLSHLHYALLPSIDPLDTAAGGQIVHQAALDVDARWVVIDTTARAVGGEENEADVYRAFYRHCGMLLKASGIAWTRLDHAGKDLTKGHRGSSAKNDDVDVVWRLIKRDNNDLRLEATHRRMQWVPETVDLRSTETDDGVVHITDEATYPTGTWHVVDLFDRLEVPVDITQRGARGVIREHDLTASSDALRAALRLRQVRAETDPARAFGPRAESQSGAERRDPQNPRSGRAEGGPARFGAASAATERTPAPLKGAQVRERTPGEPPDDLYEPGGLLG